MADLERGIGVVYKRYHLVDILLREDNHLSSSSQSIFFIVFRNTANISLGQQVLAAHKPPNGNSGPPFDLFWGHN